MAVDEEAAGCGCTSRPELACTLGPAEFRQRLDRIRGLTRAALRERTRDGLQLRLGYDSAAAAEVRELVALERACCGFLDFQLREQGDRLLVNITAPAEAKDTVEEIFSEFAGKPPASA
jgi:hypothetical protein